MPIRSYSEAERRLRTRLEKFKDRREAQPSAFPARQLEPYDLRTADPTGGYLYDFVAGTTKSLLGRAAFGGYFGVNPMDYAGTALPGIVGRQLEKTAVAPYARHFNEYLDIESPLGKAGRVGGTILSRLGFGFIDPTLGLIATPLSMFLGPLFGRALEKAADVFGFGPDPTSVSERQIYEYLTGREFSPDTSYEIPEGLAFYGDYGEQDRFGLYGKLDPLGELYGLRREPNLGMGRGFFDFPDYGYDYGDWDYDLSDVGPGII